MTEARSAVEVKRRLLPFEPDTADLDAPVDPLAALNAQCAESLSQAVAAFAQGVPAAMVDLTGTLGGRVLARWGSRSGRDTFEVAVSAISTFRAEGKQVVMIFAKLDPGVDPAAMSFPAEALRGVGERADWVRSYYRSKTGVDLDPAGHLAEIRRYLDQQGIHRGEEQV